MGWREQVAGWPVTTAAVGVAGPDGVLATVGPTDEVLPWASVTKPLTALTVLTLVEAGRIDLDEPAGPATVRHLLAHASGLPVDGRRPIAPPGTRRIYSNAGFELLAELVAQRAGRPFDVVLDDAVLVPLGFDATRLMPDGPWAGSPAAGIEGVLDDLLRLAVELLHPTLVSAECHAEMRRVAFPGLSGVLPGFGRQERNDWGLGVEIRDDKRPHWTGTGNSPTTFGHFGQSGSFLWVDPEAQLACAALTGHDFGGWAAAAWPRLADAVLATFTG